MEETERQSGSAVVVSNTSAASLSLVRALGQRGIRTIAASERPSPPTFASKYVDERVSLPDPHTSLHDYRDVLLDVAARPSVKTIAPVREEDVFVLSKHREAFAEHVRPVWPDLETLTVAHDRVALVEAARRAGVDVPETWLLDEVRDWDRRLISKARYGLVTDHYVDGMQPDAVHPTPNTQYIEPGEPPDVEDLIERMGHVPIVQEFVPGTEYTVRALYDEGDCVLTTQKALRRGYKYPRGPSIYHEAVDIPDLREAALALLDELEWHGPASVGFIRHEETGAFKMLEINPRFWSSMPCDHHAGVDYPLYYWHLANGVSGPFHPQYTPGTASHLLRGEAVHLLSVVTETYPFVPRPSLGRTAAATLSSLVTQPHFDVLDRDDPGPFVRDLWNTGRSFLPSRERE
ncbi:MULTISPECIES: ATP-grasp domain-containing protein [Haloarcula]|uniref:ATP-grasp domain-containing protein n=1 Tax=Haloarcula pellucida TaxID=1427151 RepID=A0A830GK99_9EURY|nr:MULTISPECIES: ATP-grasp domain-containing protein [Halomicroarcula]MBX0347365.1 ATP-grasp domain-containing protein [Halomicroarcula pellucida]MDS0276761.1 ATP-grasp domain-containing protein [Halomicroarcula sp. S1AR25-4]GGN88308.1 hypothetical protein GCM10009030_07880 [Halomicroarcula pellucida]